MDIKPTPLLFEQRQLHSQPSLMEPGHTRMHEPELRRLYGEVMCRVDAAEALTLAAS